MTESIGLTDDHLARARQLVDEAHANNGLAPVGLERFWEDDQKAHEGPLAEDCPQVPLGISMSKDCIGPELGADPDWYRLVHDAEYRAEWARRYNDKAEQVVGRRVLNESTPAEGPAMPHVRGLEDIFEAESEWHAGSYWLQQSADSPAELEALLDRVDQRLENLREFILPEDWEERKSAAEAAGREVGLYRHQRGPVTFATSIYGSENLVFLLVDNPELGARLRDTILRAMIERGRILQQEHSLPLEQQDGGFSFADDNCALLNPEMYEFFGYPILKGVFDEFAPEPDDWRFQHSDSNMEHLLPILGRLDLTACNFGPTVLVDAIREHMPRTIIRGCLAPFTFSRNEEVNIVAEFLRDYEMARKNRGLVFDTAGSINEGSRLSGMRLAMAAIQRWGRYD